MVNGSSHAPIAGASIELTLPASTAAVARATAAADGEFRVQGLRPGRYRLRVRALGYAPRELPVTMSATGIDVGEVALKAVAVEMERVVVRETQRDVQLAPDRNTYVVKDLPTTRGGNALDVLRNVPSVDVDIDNVVSLRGNSGVVVQVNGRPSPMKPAQLGNFLAQLPADMVEKVEVIPNPSARDDPEGVAGIINIVLRKETDAGASGGLTLTGGTTGRAEVGGNLGYQKGALSMYGSYGFMRDNRPRRDSIYRENLYLQPTTFLLEQGRRTQIPLAHTVTGSAGYKLTEQDELSADLMYSTRTEAETNNILYRNLDASRALTGTDDRLSSGTNHEYNFESTLAYKHAFAAKRHELSSELRVFRGREGGPNDFTSRSLASDGVPLAILSRESQLGYEHPDESALKVDYRWPITSSLRLETGYKGSLQTFHTTLDTRVLDTARSVYAPDPTRTSDFTYDQTVNAAYGMLNALAGNFSLQGGLRAERASTQFHLNTQNASYDNGYNSLFPSALVAYNIDDARQVKLSYSTRIRRPDDTDLIDPTIHYQDPLNVSRGNPNLKPEYIRAVELGFQQTTSHATLQLTPFYRHTLDAVRSLRTIDSLGVSTRTFANVATTDAFGADATVAMHGGRLGGFVGASAYRQQSNASNLDPTLSARTFGWTARTNASFRISKTQDLQTLLFYQAPMTVEQGRAGSRTRFSLAGRQKLMSDQLALTLRVVDPFNASREKFTTTDPRFYQVSDRRRADRGLVLSANWSFGKSPKERDDQSDAGGDNAGP
ncbi:MAG TPA: TonB-dependent receptor [Gemmatimonadaceae bacterium]|nr:TonB-dependent receptor [Gemmatimonadaceae bacterium]